MTYYLCWFGQLFVKILSKIISVFSLWVPYLGIGYAG